MAVETETRAVTEVGIKADRCSARDAGVPSIEVQFPQPARRVDRQAGVVAIDGCMTLHTRYHPRGRPSCTGMTLAPSLAALSPPFMNTARSRPPGPRSRPSPRHQRNRHPGPARGRRSVSKAAYLS
ncbi:uncharacterized protein SCHCODRAFT_02644224, partial [Schizophyllum commune H4-8]|uniref:uncharacterized protein n=1 Tax=Schizophyllum commune (strain H4-8 / FGSC 9210) TaxID=578458 RepID=UPI002160A7D0